jgi:hypothetical protein
MNSIMNKIKKYAKLIISVGILVIIAVGVLGYIALAPLQDDKAINAIKYEYDNGTVFSGDGQINKDQFKNFVRDLNYQFVQTKFDILKPVYSLVRAQYYPKDNLSDGNKVHNVISIYLERKGLLDWKVVDTKDSAITGLSFQDTVNLASQHDLTTNFPNKETYKITNYPPLTPQEIESNRKLREESDVIKNVFFASPYYTSQAKLIDEAEIPGLLSKDERLKRANDFLLLQKNTLNSLESGKEYIYPDGSKVPVSEQTKSFLKKSISGVEITIKMINSVSN